MSSHLAYLILGLGGGAVIAALGLGVTLTARSSGVVNFAHAAVGAFLAFAFYEFRETGDLVMPWPGPLHRLHLLARPTVATALVLFVAYGALLGLVLQQLVFRRLRRAPALARVVASVGLFLYFWAVIGLEWPVSPNVRPVLPRDNLVVLGRLVGVDRLALGAMVVVLAAVLWLVGRHTRFGLATTAAAENQKGAVLAGLDPDRLAALNWMLATSLAGLAMIFSAQIVALDALNNALLIVPALAAALVGNFRSYPVVAATGLAIGMAQSELLNLQADVDWLPRIGLQQGLPFLVLVVAVVWRGERLPTRGALREGRYPAAPAPRGVAVVTVVLGSLAVASMLWGGTDWRAALITSSVMALFALSVVVLTGFVGQISLASYAFAGVAAYAMVRFADAGLPFPLAPVAAVAVTCGLGVLVGLPAVKVRGLNLAIVTLGAAVAIQELLFKWEWFVGPTGATEVPEPRLGSVDLTIRAAGADYPRVAFGLLCLVVLGLCALAVANLRRGRTGLQWLAVRANEQAAAGAGIDVRWAKLGAFTVSAGLAGAAGCLLAYQRLTISADSFAVFNSLSLLAITYLAGIAVLSGGLTAGALAPVGVLAVAMGQEVGRPSPYQFVISGLLLVAMAVLYPDGITGGVRALWHRVADRRSRSGVPAVTAG
ncbi:MAG: ABC transporter permease [Microthrixaceae bacterium]